jgi:hypothetical protein
MADMANEPERPIEKLLRAAAKKRRDEAGAPFELHPATRRLLQGEVARHFAKPQREGRSLSILLAQLWPRFAWGVAILAAFGVVVWLALPGTRSEKSEALLAKNEPAPKAAPADQSLPPAPAARPAVIVPPVEAPPAEAAYRERSEAQNRHAVAPSSVGQKELAKENLKAPAASESVDKLQLSASRQSADRKKATEAETTPPSVTVAQGPAGAISGASGGRYDLAGTSVPPGNAPTTPATPAPAAARAALASAVAADETMKLKDAESGRRALAYKTQNEAASANRFGAAPTATGALGSSYAASLKAGKSLGVTARFTQVTTGQKPKSAQFSKGTAAHPVLASFQFAQTGSELRIVDGDGSVYSGHLQVADTTRRERATRSEAPATAAAARAPNDTLEGRPAAWLAADGVLPQTYFFRVTGTNRSLHKKVVFTGNLLPAAHATQTASVSTNSIIVNNLDLSQTGSAQLLTVPLINTRISGKVVVGNGKAVEINAEQASP